MGEVEGALATVGNWRVGVGIRRCDLANDG